MKPTPNPFKSVSRFALVPSIAIISLGATTSNALADKTWNGSTSTDWNTAGNWTTSGVPTGEAAIITTNTGNIATISATTPNPADIIVGNASGQNGRLDHTAGTVTTGSWVKVGHNSGNGVYNLANTATTGGTLTGFGQGSGSLSMTGGQFRLGGDNGTNTSGTGTFNMNTTGSVTVNNGSVRIGESGNGVLNIDSGTFNKTGSGNIVVGNTSGRTGAINIAGGTLSNAGELQIGNTPGSTGTVTLTSGAINTGSWVGVGRAGGTGVMNVNGGTLTKTGAGSNFIVADGAGSIGTLTQTNGLIDIQAGDFVLGNNATANATLQLNGGTLRVTRVTTAGGSATANFNGGTLQARADSTTFISGLGTANLQSGGVSIDTQTFAVTAAQAFSGVGGLTKTGSGILTLSGVNTFAGNVTVNAGTLKLGADNVIASGSGKGDVSVTGTFDVNGRTNAINGLTSTGEVFLRTNGQLSVGDNNATSDFAGRVRGQGATSLVTKIGTGTLTLSGTNDNDDARVQVNAGTLVLGKTSTGSVHSVGSGGGTEFALVINGGIARLGGSGGDQIYTASAVKLTGGTLDLNGRNEGFDGLSGTAGTISNSVSATTSTLTLGENNSNASPTFAGTIANGSGTVSVTKTGTGTQTFTGTNTYTGATTITNGRLTLGAGGSIANSTTINVLAGATLDTVAQSGWTLATGQTLKGSGTVDVGSANTLSVASGANVAPGASPGTLSVVGSLSFMGGSVLNSEINPTDVPNSDKINVTGDFAIDSLALLNVLIYGSDTVLVDGTSFVLVDYSGTWNGVSFGNYADDSYTTVGLNNFRVDYNDPNFGGTAFTFTVVPEPSSTLLGGLGLLALLRRRRA